MLPQIYRLSRPEIVDLKKTGRLIPSSSFSLLLKHTHQPIPSRFAFIVSTKIHKNATIRNKLKRHFRYSVLPLLSKTKPGFTVLFLVKKSALSRPYHQLAEEISRTFQRSQLL